MINFAGMRKFGFRNTLTAVLLLLSLASCERDNPSATREYSKVVIYCGLGYNNLSASLRNNLEQLRQGNLPYSSSDKAIVAFCHNTAQGEGYTTANPPVLLQFCNRDGQNVIDTLKTYPSDMESSTAESITKVLFDIRELFPSRSYGMIFSSHSTGWTPCGYQATEEGVSIMSTSMDAQQEDFPLTKSLGSQYLGSYRNNLEIDLSEFAAAIPMKLEYIIFDSCLMGGVEVAWELKDVCDKIVFSPAEILAEGFVYKPFAWHLLALREPDLKSICEDYFNYYDAQSGSSRSATVTLLDCHGLEKLAQVYSGIIASHRDGFESIDRSKVQPYFYSAGSGTKDWFFDLRDAAVQAGAFSGELASLDAALADCIEYHAETDYFFKTPLERCCGLSTYLPSPSRPKLTAYYKGLGWNRAVGLVGE